MADETNSTFASRRAERFGAGDKTVQADEADTKTGGDDGPGDDEPEAASSTEPEPQTEDLNALTVSDLNARAADLGIEGRSSMSKAELIGAITQAERS